MSDPIERIREALAAGPTPGPWTVMPAYAGEQCVARINAWESVPPNGVELAHETIDAAFIAACHPAAIRELLAELDAREADAERYRWIAGHCRSTSEHWGGRWSIIVEGPCPTAHDEEAAFDAAIDAARSKEHK
jgi:hypothetical protein